MAITQAESRTLVLELAEITAGTEETRLHNRLLDQSSTVLAVITVVASGSAGFLVGLLVGLIH